MSDDTIEVSRECGCILARRKTEGMERRWWFDETDAGRLVFIQEVAQLLDEDLGTDRRFFAPEEEAAVPSDVRTALDEEGYDMIVDTDGFEVASLDRDDGPERDGGSEV